MELKWLEDFLALTATRNFSKAAHQRNVTQPAFSRRIKALEYWLGQALVDRSTYPMQLTQAGVRFREVAATVAHDLLSVRTELRSETRADGAVLRFAALHTLALTFFPRWLAGIGEDLGSQRSSMVAENLHDCVELLATGACDLLICYAHPDVPVVIDEERFLATSLGTDRLVPVAAPPLANQLASLPWSSAITPYLCYTPDSFLGQVVDHLLTESERRALDVRYENAMAEALKTMALTGGGFCWLPLSSIDHELSCGRLQIVGPVEAQTDLEIKLYRRAGRCKAEVESFWHAASAGPRAVDSAS